MCVECAVIKILVHVWVCTRPLNFAYPTKLSEVSNKNLQQEQLPDVSNTVCATLLEEGAHNGTSGTWNTISQ